ncbi:DUF4810 domain-containing protein [Thauera linaloolentis]|uniref:Lipoprotein n=1 Tax=Thauera linaloolentis (strain DSM 12138 / JCM 21573 / CCUG 41526 / CIP 105981 / IAM 15112 / NBRC 102519 / 47Lol) TaxID=1123367 RepID=N6XZY6_THAL4|nr:DUF4810 domain-containing protein [Thauera linaloolentis]ENO87416.1 lipoprotein [Thauera linaloolentis 47Lol = DSM 12138]MCM8565066.1 DUF4810 domain-containing protein [Thauera linaloolentis]
MKHSSITRLAAALPAAGLLLLAGCASGPQPLYYWGEYQPALYGHFTKEQGAQEQIAALEAGLEKARAKSLAVPPGYHAHLGILYAGSEQPDQMLRHFEAEKTLYPESAAYMDFLMRKARQPE